jgi:uncharacterized protein (DUF427 family)
MASDAHEKRVTTARFAGRVIVRAGGETMADSRDAVVLHENGYGPVYYLPVNDVRTDLPAPSEHTTRCPHKGKARYWNIKAGGRTIDNAAWAYDTPFDNVAEIAGKVAFYPDRVDGIEATGL